ncbi:MAG TPA: MFS transporter [Chloroflexia bacterium]|nr:MFS transporter [Chloroflexia bacterium]
MDSMANGAGRFRPTEVGRVVNAKNEGQVHKTCVPARMDRLPWSRWHWLVVLALGITWILDGLEVTIVGSIAGQLTRPETVHFTDVEVSGAGTAYLVGAVIGALFFGKLTDMLGRKRLFMITLALYLVATVATAFTMNFIWFAACRALTGAGIGGEYAAINSAIDELIPARVRGHVDLAINGTWWVGTIIGSIATAFLLNPSLVPIDLGWRLTFGLGAILGGAILLVRRFVPESPRWLMMHGRFEEANRVVDEIEAEVRKSSGGELPDPGEPISIRPRGSVKFTEIISTMFKKYPQRAFLGFSLMVGQAFLYNAIFFTYALVLKTFYHVPSESVPWFIIPFAVGNILGPLTIGRLFDTIGRRPMIAFTYIFPGILLAITGWLFTQGVLDAVTQTIAWSIIFFFASAGASSAYLTVSEVFPLEIRAMAIALFYAVATGAAAISPVFFGWLIQSGSVWNLFYGYLIGAALMAGAGVVELIYGVKAERQSLESIASPLSVEAALVVPEAA